MFKRNMLLISVLVLALSLSGCFGIFGSNDPAKIVVNKTSVELDLDENKTADLTVVIKTKKDKDLVVEDKDITWSIANAVVEPSEAGTDNGATDPVATLSAETGDKVTVTAKSIGNAVVTVKYGDLQPVKIEVAVVEEAVTPEPDEEEELLPLEITFDVDKDTFFSAAHASFPDDETEALYIIESGEERVEIADGILTMWNSRWMIGMPSAQKGTETSESDTETVGILDLSKPYVVTVEFGETAKTDENGVFQVYVDNNTTSESKSFHGKSRIHSMNNNDIKSGEIIEIKSSLGTESSFLNIRVDSKGKVNIKKITIDYQE